MTTVPRAYAEALLLISRNRRPPTRTVRRLAAGGFIAPTGYAEPRNPWTLTLLGTATLRAAYPLGVQLPKVRIALWRKRNAATPTGDL